MCQGMCKSSCNHSSLKAFGLLALRLTVGIIFISSGYMKLGDGHFMVAGMMQNMLGLPNGSFWAYLVGGLEVLGGAMVILGVYAKYASAVLAFIMVVALLTVHRGGPLMGPNGAALALVTLGATLGLMGTGAGKWRLVQCECHCKSCMNKGEKMGGQGGCACGGAGACGCGKDKMNAEIKK